MTKPIQIRDEEAVTAIREAAALSHRSLTDVVKEGARLILERERRLAVAPAQRRKAIDDAIARYQRAIANGRMPTDEDFYDEDGLPR
jgi:hypothetical protein